jgi:signal transduction histidine kinase
LNEELQARTGHKTAFLSRMSHEMRTPLVGVIGSADILASELNKNARDPNHPCDPELLREYTAIIQTCSHHLLVRCCCVVVECFAERR